MEIFSIVTPSFNHDKFLAAAIDSVLSQQGDFYIDYIIMDGGSTDGSVDIIRHYEQWLEQNCDKQEIDGLTYYTPRTKGGFVGCLGISYRWHSGPDKGHADSINTAMDAVKGSYFAYLNSDDIYEPMAFQLAMEDFKADESIDVVYGNAVFIDALGDVTGAYPSRDVNKFDLAEQCYISQPSLFMRMPIVRLAGKFNPHIRNSLDYEYWMRLRGMGAKFDFITPVLSATRIHGDTKTSRNQTRIKIECLAIAEHYTGHIPLTWSRAMAMDASGVGILSSRAMSVLDKVRKFVINAFSPFYFLFKRGAITKERKRLFNS